MKKHTLLGVFKSKGRLSKEPISKYRSPFQRDRDRIIHSASFRRLKHKTQVLVNTEGDHIRTRINHSIEVAQIARSIAKYLNLNEDLSNWPRGENRSLPLPQILRDPDLFGGEEDRIPWVEKAFENAKTK